MFGLDSDTIIYRIRFQVKHYLIGFRFWSYINSIQIQPVYNTAFSSVIMATMHKWDLIQPGSASSPPWLVHTFFFSENSSRSPILDCSLSGSLSMPLLFSPSPFYSCCCGWFCCYLFNNFIHALGRFKVWIDSIQIWFWVGWNLWIGNLNFNSIGCSVWILNLILSLRISPILKTFLLYLLFYLL